MESAGRAVASEVASKIKGGGEVVVFAGTGRNGGDGMVAARILSGLGYRVSLILVGRELDIRDDSTLRNFQALKSMSETVRVEEIRDSTQLRPRKADALIDGLLGTGAKGSVRAPVLQAIKAFNESQGFKVAIDLPSGLDADTGEALGEIVRADVTVTLHRVKRGLEKAESYAGKVKVADIGIPPEAESFVGPGDVDAVKRDRPSESHKGDFGRVLVIGGSEVYSGAPALVGLAALRTGADLVYVAAPKQTALSISSISPNLITIKLEGEHFSARNLDQLKPYFGVCNSIAIGPGLGLHKETLEGLEEFFKVVNGLGKPVLFDADAVKAYGSFGKPLKVPAVFTPHAGEYEKLTGHKPPQDLASRAEHVKMCSRQLASTILLKGRVDVISNGERTKLNYTGNPAMTAGGTGDVLSGVVAAFLAMGFDTMQGATAGAFINGAAGDYVYREKGYHLVASDLLDKIPLVIENPMDHRNVRFPN